MEYKALSKLVSRADQFLTSPPDRPTVWTTPVEPLRELINLKSIDRMINGDLLASPRSWRFVKDGKRIDRSQFTEEGSGDVHPATVIQLLRDGATLALSGLEKYWQPTRDFCRSLTFETGIRVDAVAFLTPPSAAGFSFHPDWQSVLIAQVEGSKKWTLKPPVSEAAVGRTALGGGRPGQYTPDENQVASLPTELEVTLHPGDVLWIPSGWLHAGNTEQDISLHLSFGFSSFDRGWLSRQLVEFICTSEKVAQLHRLGEQLPWGCVHDSGVLARVISEAASELSSMLAQMEDGEVAEFVRSSILKEFPRPHVSPATALRSDPNDQIALNEDSLISQERLTGGGLRIVLPQSKITVQGKTADILEALSSASSAESESLTVKAGSLSDDMKRRLLERGVLRSV